MRTCDTLKGKCYLANLAQDSWMYSWYVSVMFHFCLPHRNKKNWPRCLSLLSPIWKWDWGFIINSTRYKVMKIIDRSGDEQSFILTFLVCTAVYAHKAQWFFCQMGLSGVCWTVEDIHMTIIDECIYCQKNSINFSCLSLHRCIIVA